VARLAAASSVSCTYSISPTSRSLGSGAETSTISVTTPSGCSWTAVSNVPWVTITLGSSGSGNGTVSYSVAANPSPSSRTGTLTIAGQTFTITQAGSGITNTAPFGYVDIPAPGATVRGTIEVVGWGLDQEDSSLTAELLVDGNVVSSSPTRFARPDVCAAFASVSHCSSSNPGVRFSWATTTVSNGAHALSLRVTDPQGASATVGSRTVTVNNP
jgi:hypothetical protein